MTDDARVTQFAVEVAAKIDGNVRVTQHAMEVVTSQVPTCRVTHFALEVLVAQPLAIGVGAGIQQIIQQ